MSEADEKRYSAKEICDELTTVTVAFEYTEAGKSHSKAINAICNVFLERLLGRELYHQAIKELTQDLINDLPGPDAAIMAAMMTAMRRDDDVPGSV